MRKNRVNELNEQRETETEEELKEPLENKVSKVLISLNVKMNKYLLSLQSKNKGPNPNKDKFNTLDPKFIQAAIEANLAQNIPPKINILTEKENIIPENTLNSEEITKVNSKPNITPSTIICTPVKEKKGYLISPNKEGKLSYIIGSPLGDTYNTNPKIPTKSNKTRDYHYLSSSPSKVTFGLENSYRIEELIDSEETNKDIANNNNYTTEFTLLNNIYETPSKRNTTENIGNNGNTGNIGTQVNNIPNHTETQYKIKIPDSPYVFLKCEGEKNELQKRKERKHALKEEIFRIQNLIRENGRKRAVSLRPSQVINSECKTKSKRKENTKMANTPVICTIKLDPIRGRGMSQGTPCNKSRSNISSQSPPRIPHGIQNVRIGIGGKIKERMTREKGKEELDETAKLNKMEIKSQIRNKFQALSQALYRQTII